MATRKELKADGTAGMDNRWNVNRDARMVTQIAKTVNNNLNQMPIQALQIPMKCQTNETKSEI